MLPVLPFRTWFNRWFRSVSDHVSDIGADTQQVVRTARDDVVHELRSSGDGIAGKVANRLDALAVHVRAEASGVAEVALATERRLARLEASVGVLLAEGDATSTALVDGPWVHRALAVSPASTVVVPGRIGRLAEELRGAGHLVVHASADGSADLVVVRDAALDELDALLEVARRALAPGGRVVLLVDGRPADKSLDGWDVLDERVVVRHDQGWRPSESGEPAPGSRSLYVLG
jgi:SAM-dependent methyltransferase